MASQQRTSLWFSILALLTLGGCAYAVNDSFQDITFVTPGAQDAKCDIYVSGLRYQVYPPQTINIKKDATEMHVDCYAPGNRHVEIFLEPKFSSRSFWGGPAGMAWDYASQSLHYFPSVIAVDFSKEELKPNPLPQHNNPDIRQPETYDLEEFRPSTPRLNSDKYKTEPRIYRHGENDLSEEYGGEDMEGTGEVLPGEGGKGDFHSVIESLNDGGSEAHSDPLPIYPGQ